MAVTEQVDGVGSFTVLSVYEPASQAPFTTSKVASEQELPWAKPRWAVIRNASTAAAVVGSGMCMHVTVDLGDMRSMLHRYQFLQVAAGHNAVQARCYCLA